MNSISISILETRTHLTFHFKIHFLTAVDL